VSIIHYLQQTTSTFEYCKTNYC